MRYVSAVNDAALLMHLLQNVSLQPSLCYWRSECGLLWFIFFSTGLGSITSVKESILSCISISYKEMSS